MENNKGFIELKNTKDFWSKLKFDYAKLKKDNEDVYLAFNFFVTSYHLLDWLFEGKYSNERADLNKNEVLKICNHIVTGIKHFEPNSKRHNTIEKIEKVRYFAEDYIEEGYVESPIMISLNEKSRFGKYISISDLADEVVRFWEFELKKRNII